MKHGVLDKKQDQKHDQGYKRILSNKDNFLHFLQKYIAVPWAAGATAGNLERINGSFIDKKYHPLDSDIVYRLKIGDTDVYFYILLELQSGVDFTMPYRLLRYMSNLLDDVFRNTDEKLRERKDFKLPAVVPIIFYNGGDNWTVAGSYREYTAGHETFGDSTINFRYLLFDLNRMGEDRFLSTKELLDIIFMLDRRRYLKTAGLDEVVKSLSELASGLTDDALSELCGWVVCVLLKGNITPELENNLKQSLKKGDDVAMKCALDVWMEEKVEKGREDGWEKGWEKGVAEEKEKNAKAMKARGIDMDTIVQITGLMPGHISQL